MNELRAGFTFAFPMRWSGSKEPNVVDVLQGLTRPAAALADDVVPRIVASAGAIKLKSF